MRMRVQSKRRKIGIMDESLLGVGALNYLAESDDDRMFLSSLYAAEAEYHAPEVRLKAVRNLEEWLRNIRAEVKAQKSVAAGKGK